MWQDLLLYIRTLKYLGILCTSHERETNKFVISKTDEIRAKIMLIFTQLLSLIIFNITFNITELFYLQEYNKVGNIYLIINIYFSCFVISFISAYCYARRRKHTQLLQRLLRLNAKCRQSKRSVEYKRLYFLYLSLSVCCVVTYIAGFRGTYIVAYVSYVISFTLSFILCGILMIFFICIQILLDAFLKYYNDCLVDCQQDYTKIKQILWERNEMLRLCENDINPTYGIVMVVIASYVLFILPSGPFFLITVVFEKEPNILAFIVMSLTSVLWSLPWIVLFILVNTCRKSTVEVCIIILKGFRYCVNWKK